MASVPQHETLNIEEQLARIAKMRVETDKRIQDTRLATPQMFFQGGAVMAGLIAAVAALIKVFFS